MELERMGRSFEQSILWEYRRMSAHNLTTIAAVFMLSLAAQPALAMDVTVGLKAIGPTTIAVGNSLSFVANFDWEPYYHSSNYGGNPEPSPEPGYQYWLISGYSESSESLGPVWFEVNAAGSTTTYSAYSPSSEYFSVAFNQPGTFDVTLNGTWEVLGHSLSYDSIATRYCYGYEWDSCDAWSYGQDGGFHESTYSGGFGPITLQVQVQAVPEPATAGLYLMGLVAVFRLMRRRSGQNA